MDNHQRDKLILQLYLKGIINLDTNSGKYYIDEKFNQHFFEESLGFENIAIKQKKQICHSRLDVCLSSQVIRGVSLSIPLIAANMSTVVDADFIIKLNKLGAMGVMHRACSNEEIISSIKKISERCRWTAGSIGILDKDFDLAKEMIRNGCNIIFIDVAHGYSDRVFEMAKRIKNFDPATKVVLGNTTNVEMLRECHEFCDALKVGIAQGFACETKNTAGCTEKQFSAVLKFKELSKEYGIPIISDGGIREPADFVKAIGAGASSVMAGKIFAECPESAADLGTDENNKPIKIYAGMASGFVQEQWKGLVKEGTCTEGGVRYLPLGEPVEKMLERYSGALRSGITYAGAQNIYDYQRNVEFIRV